MPAGILLAGILLPAPSADGKHIGNLPSVCLMQNYLHIPCPTCGLTRAVVCLLKGDVSRSFAFHPLGGVMVILLLTWIGLCLAGRSLTIKQQNILAYSLAFILLVIWGLRMTGYIAPLP